MHDPQGYYAVWQESLLEGTHLRELDWEGVRDLNTQVIRLEWRTPGGRSLYHYPDILMRTAGGITLVNVSARRWLQFQREVVYDLTTLTCNLFGWRHEVGLDDVSIARQRNVRYLSGFRGALNDAPMPDEAYPPTSFWGLRHREGGGVLGGQRAAGRLWARELVFNPDQYLEDYTPLWRGVVPSPRHVWSATR